MADARIDPNQHPEHARVWGLIKTSCKVARKMGADRPAKLPGVAAGLGVSLSTLNAWGNPGVGRRPANGVDPARALAVCGLPESWVDDPLPLVAPAGDVHAMQVALLYNNPATRLFARANQRDTYDD